MMTGAPHDGDQSAPDHVEQSWTVDCDADDTFLFASIENISAMGIFLRTNAPLEVGTRVRLCFAPAQGEAFSLPGEVQWVNRLRAFGENPNPGMGVLFVDLQPEQRERLVAIIRTIIYLRERRHSN